MKPGRDAPIENCAETPAYTQATDCCFTYGNCSGRRVFSAVAALMRGSEKDFIRRLVDNSPHITVGDEFRNPRLQPAALAFPDGAVEIRGVRPLTETRDIRDHEQIIDSMRRTPGLRASPVLAGQALISFAGRDVGVTLNGVIPAEIATVSTIGSYMVRGTIDALIANPDGIVIGDGLAHPICPVATVYCP